MPSTSLDADGYRSYLRKAFEWLRGSRSIDEQFRAQCQSNLNMIPEKKSLNWNYNPDLEFDLKESTSQRQQALLASNGAKLRLRGEIRVSNGTLTSHKIQLCIVYTQKRLDSESCCVKQNYSQRERIVRKFHFDSECSNIPGHPKYHLQYGGKYHPKQGEAHPHFCFEKNLELPRIPCLPISLVSVIHICMSEFGLYPDITKDNRWKSIVKDTEKLFSGDFIQSLSGSIQAKKIDTIYDFYSH